MQGKHTENLISPAAADRLISAHDGDLALLYIFMQRTGSADLEKAAGELCRTLGEMEAAYEKLRRMGLAEAVQSCPVRTRAEEKLPPPDELPEYPGEYVVSRAAEDPAFSAILHEAERIYGKRLGTPHVRKLFGIYDYFALPAEIIMVLLNYCASTSKLPNGSPRPPSMHYIEQEAYRWVRNEILTLEQAEEYMENARLRQEESTKLAASLGIRGRQLSPTEKKYIEAWLDGKYAPDVIMLAYDRTVTNTGSLKWGYMNKILENWKEKGFTTVEEIEEKESRRRPGRRGEDKPVDMSDLNAMFKEM